VSSDYVFDGENPPYREDDPVSPLSEYGRSKVEGEGIALQRPGAAVLRIPLLIGAGPTLEASGFVAQMRELLLAREPVELDDVLIRFPTWTRDVAHAIRFIMANAGTGIFHFSSLRGNTRYGSTLETARILGLPSDHLRPSDSEVPRLAPRPRNSQLQPARLRAMGYDRFTDPKDATREILAAFI
jgi:dTDP-4-dehydrorhamnose reductase